MILTTQEKIERYTANGWWGTKTIDDYFLNLVEQTPEKIAIVDPTNKASLCNSEFLTYTYTQLDDKIDQVADTLLSLGIEKDDIVAIQLPNIVELVITYFAVLESVRLLVHFLYNSVNLNVHKCYSHYKQRQSLQ